MPNDALIPKIPPNVQLARFVRLVAETFSKKFRTTRSYDRIEIMIAFHEALTSALIDAIDEQEDAK